MVTVDTYFTVPGNNLRTFKSWCVELTNKTKKEPGHLYYDFHFNGNEAHCNEGYCDADAFLEHLNNVYAPLCQALTISKITCLEIHCPESEVAKLRKPFAPLQPPYFFALDICLCSDIVGERRVLKFIAP